MDPEPIFRRAPDLPLDDFVDASGERFNRGPVTRDWWLDNRTPARKSGSIHSHRPNLRIRPSSEQSGQWCCRSNAAEKRRPDASVASVLVAQNSDAAAVAQQLDSLPKALAAFKNFKAKTTAGSTHVPINKRILQPLING